VNDYCVVRAATVPEADHYLTVFLQLLTDEASVLKVVRRFNIFPPYSDGREVETEAALWQARVAAKWMAVSGMVNGPERRKVGA
jgi:hypothetical protein